MAPRKHNVIHAAIRLVDAVLRRVHRIVVVRVVDERFGIDDLVGVLATNNESILLELEERRKS